MPRPIKVDVDIDVMPQIAPPNTTGVPRIVIPAGIGDAYWVMVKLEAFCRREGITGKPTVILLSEANQWDSMRLRSIAFLERISFITLDERKWIPTDPVDPRPQCLQDLYDESRVKYGRTVYPGFMGYEYFISYNGLLNTGHWLERDDDLECNWFLPLRASESQKEAGINCTRMYGKYAIFYFSNFTERILKQFSVAKIVESIRHFTNITGLTPIFVGSDWDLNWIYLRQIIEAIPNCINLIGKTSLDEAFGIMQEAEVISGYHCGLTNIGIMLRKPTVLIWDYESFPAVTPLAVAPPETRMTTYIPLYAKDLTTDLYLNTLIRFTGEHCQ